MTQITNHTPGPWSLDGINKKGYRRYIGAPGWGRLAKVVIRMQGDPENHPEGEANARLIAAAPELLNIAKLIEAAYAEGPASTFHTRLNELAGGTSGNFAELLIATLAKVRGEL